MSRGLLALACVSLFVLGGSQAGALPRGQVASTPGFLLVQGGPASPKQRAQEDREAPLTELYEVLGATRAKLEELTKATATLAADTERRQDVQVLKQDNERLAAELEQANARRIELETSGKLAEARVAELTKTVDAARRESARLKEDLAQLRRQHEQLNQDLASANAAREATGAEAEKVRGELVEKLEGLADEVERSRAEVASSREQLETNRAELAKAKSAREQIEARVIAMEKVVARPRAEAERLKAELAELKGQLEQAAGAAVAAERARRTVISEAEALRGEAERAREELAAARNESARFKAAHAELEQQIASLHTDSRSATESARDNLVVVEQRIKELNAALDLARREEAAPAHGPQPKPAASEGERTAATQSPATAQPPVLEPAGKIGGDQPADSAKPSSPIGPAAPLEGDARLASLHAKIEALNKLEVNAGGVDLFSGVESAVDREVHVSTTAAWAKLLPVGQESYLESLLDTWVAVQGGEGPAVVRIVDPGGRVLVEKSRR